MASASSTFTITSWDEKAYHEEGDGRKLTRASVVYTYTGDIVGQSRSEFVMVYTSAEDAVYMGLEHVVGTLAGQAGSFVLKHSGIANAGGITNHYEVVAGSGTGALTGLTGSGTYSFGHLSEYPMVLAYTVG